MTPPTCRACHTLLTTTLVDLGSMPLANSYLKDETVINNEQSWPLHARVCPHCFLVQVDDVVLASDIFSSYAYFSSYSSSWVAHAKRYVSECIKNFGLGPQSFVVEVASNDGYLLKHFVSLGIPVLGVEPAANVAAKAEEVGVRSKVAFFGKQTAEQIVAEYGQADLIAANNVLAHVPDIIDFASGFTMLLKDDGVASFEFPHLLNLIEQTQFDTIYHEHYSYLSLLTVESIFSEVGLRVFNVETLSTHGGSLRVWACKQSADKRERKFVNQIRNQEKSAYLDTLKGYEGFAPKVELVRTHLLEFLHQAKADGRSVVAYGAAAKGNTLLNYCRVGPDLIPYCVDANPHKQNTLLPGSHIPVYAPDKLRQTQPDYILILPWNLKSEISESQAYVREWGAQFVTAIPGIEIF